MRKVISLIFLLNGFYFGQDNSLKNYFPLSVGNYWQYKVSYRGHSNPDSIIFNGRYDYMQVIKDTIIGDLSIPYYKLKYVHWSDTTKYLRYDSLKQSIIDYSPGWSDPEPKYFDLASNVGDFSKYRYTEMYCSKIDSILWFGKKMEYRQYYNSPAWEDVYGLAKGIGLVKMVYNQSWGYTNITYYDLVYARIDGIEYGKLITNIDYENILPVDYSLSQNYPKPFNPITTINYSIPKINHISIIVYNSIGEEVVRLVDKFQLVGNYNVIFNGNNISSGVYFYQIKAGEYLETKKMLLIK